MARITYEIRIKNRDGLVVARFTGKGRGATGGGLQAFSYVKRLRTSGEFELRIHGDDERIATALQLGTDDTCLDYIVEIWRRDPLGGIGWYRDLTGLHRAEEWVQEADGSEIYISRGRGLNDWLASEEIRYAAGSAEASKSGAAETVAKEFVDENIGPGAGVDGLGNTRVRSGLTIEADAATGDTWTGARANKNLLEVIREIAEFTTADYHIVNTTTDDYTAVPVSPFTSEFQWRDDRWGSDKSIGNTAGNPPAEFSAAKRTATNITLSYSHLDEINVCDVLGQGTGAVRNVRTRNTALATLTDWSRRAVARQANTEALDAGLDSIGDALLNDHRAKRTITFTAQQTQSLRYGPPGAFVVGGVNLWDWGDLVTVKHRGISYNTKITGVRIVMSADGTETIQPECEDEP